MHFICLFVVNPLKSPRFESQGEKRMKLKTSAIAILAAFMATSAVAAPTAAQLQDRVYGSVFTEYYAPDIDKQESAAWGYQGKDWGAGFNVGYQINETWGIRAELLRQSLENFKGEEIKGNRAGVDLVYSMTDLPIYLVGGLKNITTGQSASAANIGVGSQYFINDNFAVFFEANRYQGISKGFADAGIKLGLTYVFGEAPAVAPTPAPEAPVAAVGDADKDGVTDDKDKCADTPIVDKVDDVGCSIFTEKSVTIKLNAQFDNNSDVVKDEYLADIEKLADFLKRFPNTDVEIGGHASNVGKPAYNLKLSQRRADAVAKILVEKFAIESSRVKAVGYGVTKPVAKGNSKEAHKMNRRIEGVVTASVKEAVKR